MNNVVLITGCSTGIGAATARRFADAGWRVVATMRDPTRGASLSELPDVDVARLDVTDQASVDAAVQATLERHGRIDVLVNNAGLGLFGPFETSPWELVENQFATNTLGVMRVTRAVLPGMRARGHGTVINVTSIGGLTTMPLNAVYHAAKFAVDAFSEGLRYELDPMNIVVKVVAPGGVSTPFFGTAFATADGFDAGDYAPTVQKVRATFAGNGAAYSTADQVADAILGAATDGRRQLRYLVGDDAAYLLNLRRERPIEDYVELMAARFGIAGPPARAE